MFVWTCTALLYSCKLSTTVGLWCTSETPHLHLRKDLQHTKVRENSWCESTCRLHIAPTGTSPSFHRCITQAVVYAALPQSHAATPRNSSTNLPSPPLTHLLPKNSPQRPSTAIDFKSLDHQANTIPTFRTMAHRFPHQRSGTTHKAIRMGRGTRF